MKRLRKKADPAVAQSIEDDEAYRSEPAAELTEPKADVTGIEAQVEEQTVFADEQSEYELTTAADNEPSEFGASKDAPPETSNEDSQPGMAANSMTDTEAVTALYKPPELSASHHTASETGSDDTQPGMAAHSTSDTEAITAMYKPPELSTSLPTPSETRSDDSQPGMAAHSTTGPEPAAVETLGDDQTLHTEDEHAHKKVRLALCSAHDGFRVYLTKLLVSHGIDVVTSAPLYEENLAAMDPDEFDVLLIDRDEYATTSSPELGYILAGWRGPLLYNDTQAMKTALRQGNYAFGKDLAGTDNSPCRCLRCKNRHVRTRTLPAHQTGP